MIDDAFLEETILIATLRMQSAWIKEGSLEPNQDILY